MNVVTRKIRRFYEKSFQHHRQNENGIISRTYKKTRRMNKIKKIVSSKNYRKHARKKRIDTMIIKKNSENLSAKRIHLQKIIEICDQRDQKNER